MFFFFFVVIGFINIIIHGFKFSFRNPFTFILLWWYILPIITQLELTDLYIPDDKLFLILIVFHFGLFLGSIIVKKKKEIDEIKGVVYPLKVNNLLNYLFYLVLGVQLLLAKRAVSIFLEYGFLGYRSLTFSSETNEGILFFNPYLEILYGLICSPFTLFTLFFGAHIFYRNKSSTWILRSVLLLTLDSFIRLGRFNFYFIIIVLLFTFRKNIFPKLKLKKYIVLLIIIPFSISILRDNSTIKIVAKSLVEYHIVGFNLFTKAYMDKDSRLNNNLSYGMGTLGGIDYISTLIIRRFSPEYDSNYSYIVQNHHLPVETGYNKEYNFRIYHNAFYTILFTLYSDFKYIGVFFIPFLLSFIAHNNYQKFKNKAYLSSYTKYIIIFFILYFSVFQSYLQSHIVFLTMLFLLYISRYEKS